MKKVYSGLAGIPDGRASEAVTEACLVLEGGEISGNNAAAGGGVYLGELPGIGAAEERGAGAEADGSSAAEDVLGDRPVQRQHRQLVTYFH